MMGYKIDLKEYALYKGDMLLGVGTIKEISESTGIEKGKIRRLLYPSYVKNCGSNARVLIELEVEE